MWYTCWWKGEWTLLQVLCYKINDDAFYQDKWIQEQRKHYSQCCTKCENFVCMLSWPFLEKMERVLSMNSWKTEMEAVMAPDKEVYDLLKKTKQSNITSFFVFHLPLSHAIHINHHVYWSLTYILSCFVHLLFPWTHSSHKVLTLGTAVFTVCGIFQECNQHEQGLTVFQQLRFFLKGSCPFLVTWIF